jgi:ferredoxin
MKLTADLGRCIGAGQCVLIEPDVFEQEPTDGTVRLRRDRLPAASSESVRQAVQLCPVKALRLKE